MNISQPVTPSSVVRWCAMGCTLNCSGRVLAHTRIFAWSSSRRSSLKKGDLGFRSQISRQNSQDEVNMDNRIGLICLLMPFRRTSKECITMSTGPIRALSDSSDSFARMTACVYSHTRIRSRHIALRSHGLHTG